MPTSRSDRRLSLGMWALVGAVTLLTLQVSPGSAQIREVVGKEIAVADREAAIRLEFADGGELSVALRDGAVWLDGEQVGVYEGEDDLYAAWHGLLGDAASLDDGPLARALLGWDPPSNLEDESRRLAERIHEAIHESLSSTEGATQGLDLAPLAPQENLLRALLSRSGLLAGLAEALDEIEVELDEIHLRIGEYVLIERETEFEGTLLAIDGDVEIEGAVDGDVIVVDGTLRISEGSSVAGDVLLSETRLLREEGTVEGSIVNLTSRRRESGSAERRRLYEEIRREFEEEYGRQERGERAESNGPFESIVSGFFGLLHNAVNLLILGLLGCTAVFFAGSNLEFVAVTARRSPVRAGAVGIAGAFLACPIWILGIAALSVSLIGIPVLLVWVPLFPVAMVVAAGLGLFAVASNLGEWMSKQRYPYLRWIRSSNPYTLVGGGLVGLAIPFMLANTVEMAGAMFGLLEGLLTLVAWMTCLAFALIGFGAVILTRAGRRPEFYQGDTLDDAFWDLDESPSDGADWFGAGSSRVDPAGAPATSGDDGAPERSSEEPSQEGGSRQP